MSLLGTYNACFIYCKKTERIWKYRIIFIPLKKIQTCFSGTGIIIENYRYIEHLQLHLNYINDNTSQLATLLAAYGRRFEEQEILVEYAAEEMKKYKPNYIVFMIIVICLLGKGSGRKNANYSYCFCSHFCNTS